MDLEKTISNLTDDEKILLVSGTNTFFTNKIERLNISALKMSDGPHGLRVRNDSSSIMDTKADYKSTAFPTAITTACSFNPENSYKIGKAMAIEAKHYGIDVILGPACNIQKNPLCGRNFEYYSEDPILSSSMAIGEVNGIQSENVIACVKHFALNSSENYRFNTDELIDTRALNEIYLRNFERVIKQSKPKSVMCAYNKINSYYCSLNKWLLTDTLQNKWGYDGLIMTDWGAIKNRADCLNAGLDLEMPGDTSISKIILKDALNENKVSQETLNKSVAKVLKLVDEVKGNEKGMEPYFEEHNEIAKEVAIDSAVLLKNKSNSLPLNKNEKYLVIGELFSKMRYQGSGSSYINAFEVTSPKDAFDKKNVDYTYLQGYNINDDKTDKKLLNEVKKKINSYDTILLFLGLNGFVESEGCDRENMKLSNNQIELLEYLTKCNKKIIVILYSGSPVELPNIDKVDSILYMGLPGQAGGDATYSLLFGEASPSGKLTQTWPIKYGDVPYSDIYSKDKIELYKESIFVGYRYYSTCNKQVNFPFGYGLSYSSFQYDNYKVEIKEDKVIVSLDVKNIGKYKAKDVIEIYSSKVDSKIFRPIRELKGFKKVELNAGESKSIQIEIPFDDLKVYSNSSEDFVLEEGEYDIQLCSDSNTVLNSISIRLKGDDLSSLYTKEILEAYSKDNIINVSNETFEKLIGYEIPKLDKVKPFNLDTRVTDLKKSFMGKILYKVILNISANKPLKLAKKIKDESEREIATQAAIFTKRVVISNSIYSMTMAAGKECPYNFALGIIDIANGHIIKGVKKMTKKI